ncbi:MAG: GNAT family N-acetyltransferase [Paraburkholderia sp.]|uniref:GNAT family N-acetyltransferase n=1 Tax=Paraburkholderia sp. TaxID=1926495 RepID=UPI0012051498|nr:GNAT family N-acetyltransferase [Paraburkholderia sp.]TAM07009.1 MAG: GNAT family N-acetyltransferase [Paraburkholderia sp.]
MNELCVVATVRREDPRTPDATVLLEEFGAMIALYRADDRKARFAVEDLCTVRSAFVVARTIDGRAIGCGALRRYSFEVAEFVLIYRRPEWHGTGSVILRFLEDLAAAMDYRKALVQVHEANRHAIALCLRHGYEPRSPVGECVGLGDTLCFAKALPVAPNRAH